MLLFLSLLAVGAQLSLVVIAIGALHPTSRAAIVREVGPNSLAFAATIATVSMAGSLYLSEGAHFVPCKLCWYQRIAMYGAAVILMLAAVRREFSTAPYVIALAAPGGAISIYHMLVERFPSLETSACDPTNPCSLIWTERFGYLTIPTMALSGFALIIVVLLIGRSYYASAAA